MATEKASKPHILFVDDEQEFLFIAQEYFSPIADIDIAVSGAQALEKIRQNAYDVIISDHRMPGMNGTELLAHSLELLPEAERILITAYADLNTVLHSVNDAHVTHVFTKPADLIQVKLAILHCAKTAALRKANKELIQELQSANSDLEEKVKQRNIELHQAYEYLMQLQETRQRMIRMSVHDLKSPISNIDLVLAELERSSTMSSDEKELVDMGRQSVQVMSSLVEDMLEVAVLSQPGITVARDEVELAPFLLTASASYIQAAEKKSIQYSREIADTLPIIMANAQQLQQIISNLISNALKYTQPGGHVQVKAYTEEQHFIFEVQDSGQGMTEDDIANAFQEFRRLSARPTGGESSTGLGLFIVKKIAELHGGTVQIISQGKNQGTLFRVNLPIIEPGHQDMEE
jgi:signal transduction histidine kinase